MRDYMKALHQRFNTIPSEVQDMEQAAEQAHKELSQRLEPTERKLLLRLMDLQDVLLYETSLSSFTAGFQLAHGIQQELSELPTYSFDKEVERWGRKLREEQGGK
jgi:hypothetical protein